MLPDGQTPHILVVNHAPEILELMRDLLGEAGYRVSTLTRPDQDIDSIVAIAPDMIIIDYMWSSSDNEWTLLNLLTIDRRTRDIPVIVCTAAVHHVYEVSGHLQEIGVRVVFKPFNIDHLLGVVANALNGKALDKDGAPPGPE